MRTPPVPSDTAPTDDQQGVSSSFALIKTRLKKARREGFSVSQHDVVIESISAAVAASGRPIAIGRVHDKQDVISACII